MIFAYRIDEEIRLELQAPEQAEELFALVDSNREFIGEHLPWALRCQTIEDFRVSEINAKNVIVHRIGP